MSTSSTLNIIFGGEPHHLTSHWGWRRHPVYGGQRFHYGVDYGCSRVPVRALERGTVYKTGYDRSAGYYVYVKYARYGVAVAYFHLSKISVKRGQTVYKGTQVGIAGSTGSSTGTHLHIGVRRLSSWQWINPETWLANYRAPGGTSGHGKVYTLKYDMKVRTGPGTSYRWKNRSELTADAKRHSKSGRHAVLKAGTKVTCKERRGNWMRIPSGWVCISDGKRIYIR